MKIHDCIKKAGKALSKDDRARLLARLPMHMIELGEEDGAVAAIDEFLMELQLERAELVLRIEDEGGEVEKPVEDNSDVAVEESELDTIRREEWEKVRQH
jgi:hypothetical protein